MMADKKAHFCILGFMCLYMAFCPFAANASDEQTRIEQLETLLQFYMQENATLTSRVKELEASVGADAASTQDTVASGNKSENTSASVGSVEKDENQATAVASPSSGYKTKFPNLDDTAICDYATYVSETSGKPERVWSSGLVANRYVDDAKKRGLTCGVGDEVAVRMDPVGEQEPPTVSSDYKTRYPDLDDTAICDYATYVSETSGEPERVWSSGLVANRYVEDAKNRGLTCGVGETVEIAMEILPGNGGQEIRNNEVSEPDVNSGTVTSQITGDWTSKSTGNLTHDLKYETQPPFHIAMNSFFQKSIHEKIGRIGLSGTSFEPIKIDGVAEFSNVLKSLKIINRPTFNWTPKIVKKMRDIDLINKAGFRREMNGPIDLISEFLSIDLDNDGDQDWLVFLYGFTQVKPKEDGYKNCGTYGCASGDVTFPVMAMINDGKGFSDLIRADKYFASGKSPHVKNARMIRIGDLNNDSQMDFIVAEGGWDNPPHGFRPSYKSHIFLSSPGGLQHKTFGLKDKAHGVAVGDIDGDSDLDFVISYVKRAVVYKNDGSGEFKSSSTLSMRTHKNFAELVDADFDGDLDLLLGVAGCSDKTKFWLNDGNGGFTSFNTKTLKMGKTNSKLCRRQTGSMDDWLNAEYNMIHHSIDFPDHLLLIVSNNHVGWGYRTYRKTASGLVSVADGKFLTGVNLSHFPYRVSRKNQTDITIYDFSFQPFKFKFNPQNGSLNLVSK